MSCTNINRNSNMRQSRKYLREERRERLFKHIRIKSIELKTNLFKNILRYIAELSWRLSAGWCNVNFGFLLEMTKEESRIKKKILNENNLEENLFLLSFWIPDLLFYYEIFCQWCHSVITSQFYGNNFYELIKIF